MVTLMSRLNMGLVHSPLQKIRGAIFFFCSLKDRIAKALIEFRLVQNLRMSEDLLSLTF